MNDCQDFGMYIPMNRNGNNSCNGLIGNTGFGRGGHGYRGYNGAYYGQGNMGGGWPLNFAPDFIRYNSFSACAKCGYCLENAYFG